MTITLQRAVTRFVVDQKGRPLVVRLTQEGVYLREKGRRAWYGPLGYGWLFLRGAELAANEARAERAKRRTTPRRMKRGLLR
jgi:hypothetical protein